MKAQLQNKKRKIVFIVMVVFASILLVCFCTFFVFKVNDSLYKNSEQNLAEIAKQMAATVDSQVNSYKKEISLFSETVSSQKLYEDKTELVSFASEYAKENGYAYIYYINEGGVGFLKDTKDELFSNDVGYQQAMSGNVYISEPGVDKISGKLTTSIYTPVYKKNTKVIVGVLRASKYDYDVYEEMKFNVFDNSAAIFLAKNNGTCYHINGGTDMIGKMNNLFNAIDEDETDKNIVESIRYDLNNRLTQSRRIEIVDQPIQIIAYAPLGLGKEFSLLLSIPKDTVLSYQKEAMNYLGILSLVIIIEIISCVIITLYSYNTINKFAETLVYKDTITELPTWNKFSLDVPKLIQSKPVGRYAYVAFDIDNFKVINDEYGYEEGNKVLKCVADGIKKNIKNDEILTRITSDHFTMLLNYHTEDMLRKRINGFSRAIQQEAFKVRSDNYSINLTYGVYVANDLNVKFQLANDWANLTRKAAKSSKIDNVLFFDQKSREKMINEKHIEDCMDSALRNGEFSVYLQSKYYLRDEKLAGAEALIRWNRKDEGIISPSEFIPVFEKNGMITKIDYFMFEEVCKIIKGWMADKRQFVRISLNLSRVDSYDPEIVSKLKEIAEKYDVSPSCIELEITESAFLEDQNEMMKIMRKIKDEGFWLAIDDFGAGYSSLSLLKDMPVDILKLDREFLKESALSARGRKIIQDIVKMAKDINIETVCEGVDTKEQIEFLKSIDCDVVQGYYYSTPIPAENFRF